MQCTNKLGEKDHWGATLREDLQKPPKPPRGTLVMKTKSQKGTCRRHSEVLSESLSEEDSPLGDSRPCCPLISLQQTILIRMGSGHTARNYREHPGPSKPFTYCDWSDFFSFKIALRFSLREWSGDLVKPCPMKGAPPPKNATKELFKNKNINLGLSFEHGLSCPCRSNHMLLKHFSSSVSTFRMAQEHVHDLAMPNLLLKEHPEKKYLGNFVGLHSWLPRHSSRCLAIYALTIHICIELRGLFEFPRICTCSCWTSQKTRAQSCSVRSHRIEESGTA